MRFWWRAMNGHLDLKTMKREEVKIFGGSYKDESGKEISLRSCFSISIENHENAKQLITRKQKVLVHKEKTFEKEAFEPKQSFNVRFLANNENAEQLVNNLFPIVCILGGFGNRARRGMGSIRIKNENFPKSIENIFTLIENIVPQKFVLKNSIIQSLFISKIEFPYIKKIQIGEPNVNLLYKINNATHIVKGKNGSDYNNALGSEKPRFASPIYISTFVTNRGFCPIITTLHLENGRKKQFDIQNELINSVL
jgi:CRISPR-associated protein Cmr1